MLILTRKMGESIMVGDDIEIKVTQIRWGSVRIGISAPQDQVILRKELLNVESDKEAACS